jgi:hypothetical protein
MLRLLLLSGVTILCAHSQVRELAEEARRFPPEFASAALLRLGGVRGEPVDWKREQVEDAFQIAGSARAPFKKTALRAYVGLRSLEVYASELDLDVVTLRSRAARAMLEFDVKRARELFQQIVLPPPVSTDCDALAPDLASYYETASEILARGFTGQERKRGEPFQFTMVTIRGIHSAAQAGPVARLLAGAPLDDAEFDAAVELFAEILTKIKPDDVLFTAAIGRDDLWSQVSTIAARQELRQVSTRPLAQAFRRFLVAHLTGVRCSVMGEPHPVTKIVNAFHQRFGQVAPALTPEDMRPAEVKESATGSQGPPSSGVGFRLRQLRYSDPRDPQWRTRVETAAREIADFQADDLAPAEAFHRQAGFFEALLELMPQDAKRDSTLEIYTATVAGSGVRQTDPVGWFWHAQVLLSRLRLAGAARLRAAFETSGDGLLSFQARLDRVAAEPRPACEEGGVCSALTGPDAMRSELLAMLLN